MSGIESIPIRFPDKWDPRWMRDFTRDVLSKMDSRNVTGVGITVSGTADDTATYTVELEAGSVSFTEMQDITTSRIIGRVTAGSGEMEELTGTQVRTVTGLATSDDVTFNTVDVGTGGYEVSSTKVVGAQGSAIASLTNSTGGSSDGTMSAVGNTSSSNEGPTINDNFTELNDKVDAILAALRTHGLIAT